MSWKAYVFLLVSFLGEFFNGILVNDLVRVPFVEDVFNAVDIHEELSYRGVYDHCLLRYEVGVGEGVFLDGVR